MSASRSYYFSTLYQHHPFPNETNHTIINNNNNNNITTTHVPVVAPPNHTNEGTTTTSTTKCMLEEDDETRLDGFVEIGLGDDGVKSYLGPLVEAPRRTFEEHEEANAGAMLEFG